MVSVDAISIEPRLIADMEGPGLVLLSQYALHIESVQSWDGLSQRLISANETGLGIYYKLKQRFSLVSAPTEGCFRTGSTDFCGSVANEER